jgi:hypothetical protein
MLREPLVSPACRPATNSALSSLWTTFLQSFSVDEAFHRKIK